MSRGIGIVVGVIAVVVVGFLALWLTDVDVVDSGELPSINKVNVEGDAGELPRVKVEGGELPSVDVDVDADSGRLPEIDVDTADIDVETKEVEVEVPKVEIETEKETISLPTIEITPADAEGDAREASPRLDPGEGDR